ncbi:MAG: hypothetical protein ABUT20_38635 [Bacteroidota bacterium]
MNTDLTKLVLLIWLIIKTLVEILDLLEWVCRIYKHFGRDGSGKNHQNIKNDTENDEDENFDFLVAIEDYDLAFHYYIKSLVRKLPINKAG